MTDLVSLINTARIPTAQRVSDLEAETETLRGQLAGATGRKPAKKSGAAVDEEDGDARAEAAARLREQEELVTAPNPINEYVDMLEEEVCRTSHSSVLFRRRSDMRTMIDIQFSLVGTHVSEVVCC